MNLKSLQNILARSKRIRIRVNSKSGVGMEWAAKTSNGEIHKYVTNGIKPPEEFEDDIESTFVWLWSVKDYVKKYSISKNLPSNWVESKVNDDKNLCLSADIANRAKHGELKKSRSNKYPKLGKLKYELPHSTVNNITLYADKVEINVSNPDEVVLKMYVIDQSDNVLGDAFQLIDYSLQAWESIIAELDAIEI